MADAVQQLRRRDDACEQTDRCYRGGNQGVVDLLDGMLNEVNTFYIYTNITV